MDGSRAASDVNIMSEQPIANNSGQNMSGSGRKRGHQHHIRHSGTRTSNVRAEEVIAALRRGDQLPIIRTIPQHSDIEQSTPLIHSDSDTHSADNSLTDSKQLLCDSSSTTDQNGNKNANKSDSNRNNTLIDVLNKNTRLELRSKNANVTIDLTNEQQSDEKNVISRDSDDWTERATGSDKIGALNSSDIDMELISKDELNDSISSGSSSGSKSKSKSKRAKKSTDVDNGAKKEKRSKRTKNLPPTEERPPLEGADADQWTENDGSTVDAENDPEAAEWSKLRCTSERTEVVAEREYRRQNRRCADYPGLAFGRSIFSSDTMMKLNIIRNELHNIMKTQLKRVCVIANG